MYKLLINICFYFALLLTIPTLAMADTDQQYHQTKRPDGSIETTYSDSEGNKMTQIQHPDGSSETHAIDKEGNETISTVHANGDVETKTKTKSN